MDIGKIRYSKNTLLILIAYLSFFIGKSSAFDYDYEPSPEMGGFTLNVDNQTEYDLKFSVTFPYYENKDLGEYIEFISNYINTPETVSILVNKKELKELYFYSKDGNYLYKFGVPGEVSEKLSIRSDEWPKDTMIVVKLRKETKNDLEIVKKEYRGTLDPFMQRHKKEHHEKTPRIRWNLVWNDENSNWKITLIQSETSTGFIPWNKLNQN